MDTCEHYPVAAETHVPLIPALYPEVSYGVARSLPDQTLFFGSGRQAMKFLVQALLKRFENLLFVLPAYTCETVVQAIGEAGGALTYVDVGLDLDMDMQDLERVVSAHPGRRLALVPTSLFGAPIRNFKAAFPDALVIEDRCQSRTDPTSTADYQLASFGPGKLVSGMGGGALVGDVAWLAQAFAALDSQCATAGAMSASWVMEHVVLRHGWRWFRSRLDGDSVQTPSEVSSQSIEPRALCEKRSLWITHSLQKADLARRVELAQTYAAEIRPALQFDVPPDAPYLRYPVNAAIKMPGVSSGRMYELTWRLAERSRGAELPGAARLVRCSMLPTHALVTKVHVRAYCDALKRF